MQLLHAAGFTSFAGAQVDGVDAGDAFDWRFVDNFGRWLSDQLTDKRDVGFAYRVSQKAVMADAGKTIWKYVHKEPAQELRAIQSERGFLFRVFWITTGEGDATRVYLVDACI